MKFTPSPYWQYYKKFFDEDPQKVECELCTQKFTWHRSTTILKAHLESRHRSEYSNITKNIPEEASSPPPIKSEAPSTSSSNHASRQLPVALPRRRSGPEDVASDEDTPDIPVSAARAKELDEAITHYIIKDLKEIFVVEGTGFQHLIKTAAPGYQMLSKDALRSSIIKLYDEHKTILQTALSSAMKNGAWVSCTADVWITYEKVQYISITGHWINENWNMESWNLAACQEEASEENIATFLKETVDDFRIENRIFSITTENSSAWVKSITNNTWYEHLSCMAKNLNFTVQQGLSVAEIAQVCERVRLAAAHFNDSPEGTRCLKDKQEILDLRDENERPIRNLTLIHDGFRTWSSTLEMLERAVLLYPATVLLAERKYKLTSSENLLLEKVVGLLQPFKTALSIVSTECMPSASIIMPLKHQLLSHLNEKNDDCDAIKRMKTAMRCNLSKIGLNSADTEVLLNKATFLDPRFKELNHVSQEEKTEMYSRVCSELVENYMSVMNQQGEEETVAAGEDGEPLAKLAKKDSGATATAECLASLFGDDFFDCSDGDQSCEYTETNASKEILQYLSMKRMKTDGNPLEFWQVNGRTFPNLAKLARKYLAVQASALVSEQLYSHAACILSEARSQLYPDMVEKLLFLNKNLALPSN